MAQLRTKPPAPAPLPVGKTRPRYGRYDQIVIDKVEYMCTDQTGETYTLARVDNPLATQTLSRKEMDVVRHSRGYRHKRDFYLPELQKARVHAGTNYICDLPDAEQKKILWKQEWCLTALRRKNLPKDHPDKISFDDEVLDAAMPSIAAEVAKKVKIAAAAGRKPKAWLKSRAGSKQPIEYEGPSYTHLRKWCKKLAGANMNPLVLRDLTRNCGNHDHGLDPAAYAFVVRFARKAATPEKPKAPLLWDQMSAAIAEENKRRAALPKPLDPIVVPSEKRLRQEITAISKFDMMAGQEGVDIAKNYFRALTVSLSDVIRPFQRVEFDEWDTHLHVIAIMTGVWETWTDQQKSEAETIRLVLCIAIDCATECVVGMSLARTPSPENASRCLEMVVSDKQPYADAAGATTPWDMGGTHETGGADAGSSFANEDIRAKNVDLGVKFMTTVAGLPWMRGKVERVLRSSDDKFVAMFAGRTFGNVVEKGEYDSEGNACLTIDEYAEALVRYKIDHYHNHPHDGLGGEAPRTRWLDRTEEFGVDPPPDDHLRHVIFGAKLSPMLGPHGLRVLGIDYNSEELNELFKQDGHVRVDVKVDLMNLGAITAKIGGSTEDGEEWVIIDGPPELFRVTAKDWIAVWDELQSRNKAVNAITREILDETVSYLMEIGRIARERRNIAQEPMDAETLAGHQKRMNVGVSFARQRIAAQNKKPVGAFDGALVVSGDGAGAGQAAPDDVPRTKTPNDSKSRPARARKPGKPPKGRGAHWKFED
jgi:putative transposase